MAQQNIDIGSGELTGDGESIRSAFDKTNQNFTEVYDTLESIPKMTVTDVGPSGPAVNIGDLWYDEVSGRTYVYYDSTWADASPSLLGPTGPVGPSADVPAINYRIYVNPFMPGNYTATGSVIKPFRTMAAALSLANSLINNSTIQPNLFTPVFIVLQGSITESITLTRGHVFLIGDGSSIHAPIYLTGTVTIDASTYEQGFDDNHFSIQGITVVAPLNGVGIHFTGDVEQQLYLQDVGLYASGTSGTGLLMDNTSSNIVNLVHGNNIKITHIGSGDVYCIDVVHGRGNFWEVDTSTTGAEQVARVGSGATLTFYNSLLNADGEVCLEAYGTGSLYLFNCIIQNNNSNESYGIWLHDSTSTATISNCYFNISAGTVNSRAVHGITGSTLNHGGTVFAPSTNRRIDSVVTLVALLTNFSLV
jgi:hypothetical protein